MTTKSLTGAGAQMSKCRSLDGLATIRVLLVGNHCLLQAGLKLVLEEAPDVMVVAEADSVASAADEYRRVCPDVVVADFFIPGMDMATLVQRIVSQDPRARIVFVGVYPAERYAAGMLQMGVLGFITAENAPSELHHAVRAATEGRRFLSEVVKEVVTTQLLDQRSGKSPVERLSRRELQILCRIATGEKLNEIAKDLCLGLKTVHTYKYRLCLKLALRTDADIARFAIENGLLGDPNGLGRSIAENRPQVQSDHWRQNW